VTAGAGADLLELALDLASEAGELLVERRRGQLKVSTKSTPTDVVTEADTAAEALLVSRITAARPDDGLLGEEGASREGGSGLRWVVDPLDGTVNYLYGLPSWSVSIAVEDSQGAFVGVVHAPLMNETFWAERGGGAFLDGEAIAVSDCTDLSQALLGTGFNYDARRRVTQARWVADVLPRIRDIRRIGSAALDLCSVAAGRLDAFAEQGLASWDGAAGGLVAVEAGAVVGGLRGAGPGPALYVASTPGVWEELHALLVSVDADHDPLAT
jgi:myo-inositol-1(or 4)-monophosphatase